MGGMHDGACVAGEGGHAWQGEHVWQGGMYGGGHVWQGACMAGSVCMAGGCVWHTVNEQAVRILLECILVNFFITILVLSTLIHHIFEKSTRMLISNVSHDKMAAIFLFFVVM